MSVKTTGYFQFFGVIVSFLSFIKLTFYWSMQIITTIKFSPLSFDFDPVVFASSLGALALCWLFWNAFMGPSS